MSYSRSERYATKHIGWTGVRCCDVSLESHRRNERFGRRRVIQGKSFLGVVLSLFLSLESAPIVLQDVICDPSGKVWVSTYDIYI